MTCCGLSLFRRGRGCLLLSLATPENASSHRWGFTGDAAGREVKGQGFPNESVCLAPP